MAIAFKELRKTPNLRSFRIVGTLTFSGNYVTGGEVPTGIVQVWTVKPAVAVNFYNKGPYIFKYDVATGKVIAYLGGVELAAGAYPAPITGDAVTMDIEFLK